MDKYFKRWFGILVLPAVLLFVLVIALPFFTGIVYSFTSWRGTYFAGGTLFQSFVGFDNYIKAFTTGTFTRSLWYTVAYTVVAVIAINLVALAFALMLGSIHRGVGMYRTVFFMPNMLGGLAMGYVWQFIFQVVYTDLIFSPDGLLHLEFMRYMTQDPVKALFALVIMTTWQSAGYMMLIYIGGLNSIPSDLYEAAAIDGAGPVRRFFKGLTERTLQAWFLTLASTGWIGETRYGGETGVVCFKNPAPSCQWCCVNKQNFVSIGALAAFAQIAHDTTVPVLAAKRVVGRLCP